MFESTKAYSGFAVDDVEKARAFYEDTLGVRTSEQYGLMTLHLAGGRDTLVYSTEPHAGGLHDPQLPGRRHRRRRSGRQRAVRAAGALAT
jgi:catechol 2,3-dioxygenase-like lactoylglutathione lyase family enzyme